MYSNGFAMKLFMNCMTFSPGISNMNKYVHVNLSPRMNATLVEEIRQLFSENGSCSQTPTTEQPSETPTSEYAVFSSLISPNDICRNSAAKR